MIENLVAMARIERGSDFGATRPVLLDRIIKQLVERERSLWPEVTINLIVSGPLQMVAADEEYLAQIMRNLLSNAAKYAPDGGPYIVRAKSDGDSIVVSVSDRGPGISSKAQRKIFAPFERADARLSKATEGSGVGLALVRGIAQAHGGDAKVESELGSGATFSLRLPRT